LEDKYTFNILIYRKTDKSYIKWYDKEIPKLSERRSRS
jgi:hypothetical protein